MSRQWTQQQRNSIYATDGTVLVSAAAGSGKTAVLVERVIKMITRKENPIDVDRLLIVTFTRAAAAEMRQRISVALNDLLEDDPFNPHLIKQKQLLYNARISTIDSFCADIIREYFHTLNISRDFKQADEGELDILRNIALDTSFELFYKNGGEDFINLLNTFSNKNGDVNLRDIVLKIANFLSTQPFQDKWIDNLISSYNEREIAKSVWGKIIIDNAKTTAEFALNLTNASFELFEKDETLKKASYPLFSVDRDFLCKLQEMLDSATWDDISNHLSSFKAGRFNTPKGYKEDPIKIAILKNREEVKAAIKSIVQYFTYTEQEICDQLQDLQKLLITLFDLVKEYQNQFDLLKQKKNILSFSDIELLTVKLLATPTENGYEKTQQGYEIANRFDSVMVDEFQDVNDVQDLIFNCVSNEQNNLFLVGDVKQSIYGFRQAKPQIFIGRKNAYKPFNEENPTYPATIILDKNFRSRKEVCNAVNFIFSKLMSKRSAQMDYDKDEMLNVGATYPESTECDFEISIIEYPKDCEVSKAVVEARYIAQQIHSMIGSNYQVTDGNTQRKATYGDFAIIMRSPKNLANEYVKTLIDFGIPAYSEIKEKAFEAQEIKIALNILTVIDNPTVDIALLSVLTSPIYGFTPDELAEMRASSRYKSLYNSLKEYSEVNEKAKAFLDELETFRAFSFTCSVDELIGKVYDATSLGAITSAVKGGSSPMKNLNILRAYARSFESNGYKTLSDFISYINKLIANNTELLASTSDTGAQNAVCVLSIHASKGLEYPVCFIADTSHQFNTRDLTADVLLDSNAGFGFRRKIGNCKYDTFPRIAVKVEKEQNEIAENLRVLYVALTRAREKLIIVSTQTNVDDYLAKLSSKIVLDSKIEPYAVVNCRSISDWIMLCALVHPSFNKVRYSINPLSSPIKENEDDLNWKYNLIDGMSLCFDDVEENSIREFVPDTKDENEEYEYLDLLLKNLSFKYPNQSIMSLPQKVNASQIAHESNNEYFEKVINKPSFIDSDSNTDATERGTAHHLLLQHCDFKKAQADVSAEISRLVSDNKLTQKQAQLINKEDISNLLNSQLVKRIVNSKNILREERFTAKIKASQIYDEYKNAEIDADIIIQGAVDLIFEEDNQLVIVDYKTDRVKAVDRLATLYTKQLDLYKSAIEQSMEMKVKECVICSLHLGKYISV